jgi:hypothetical protein
MQTWNLPGQDLSATSTTFPTDESLDLPSPEDNYSPCGTWHASGNPVTGKPVHYQMYCGKWRNKVCLTCFGRRVSGFRSDINRAYLENNNEDFYVVMLDQSSATTLARRCTENNSEYRRFPTDLWDYIIFQPFEGCPESDLDWRDLDWEYLANTPKGRRPSGKLGVEKEEDEMGEDYEVLEIATVEYKAEAGVVQEAWRKAIEQTKFANPANPEQAEEAMNERIDFFSFWLAELGGEIVKTFFRKVKVPTNSSIEWIYEETLNEVDELNYLDKQRKTPDGSIYIPF